MVEFTGERFIPGTGGWQMAYEHYHRYLFAGILARGKSVLDVASGEGYGAAHLATMARVVWAADISGPAAELARKTHRAPNLEFFQADAACLPLRSGVIDVVVAFEVLEHVAKQEEMIGEISRVLAPDGLVIISTPDRAVYSDSRGYKNPFHVRELYRDEFLNLLGTCFPGVRLMNQQIRAGSLILPEGRAESSGSLMAEPPPARGNFLAKPMYFLALCCKEAQKAPEGQASVYMDPSDALLEQWEARITQANAEFESLNQEIQNLGQWGRSLIETVAQKDEDLRIWGERVAREMELRQNDFNLMKSLMENELERRDKQLAEIIMHRDEELAARDATIHSLIADLERETRHRDSVIAGYQEAHSRLEKEFEERSAWALSLKGEVESRDACIKETMKLLDRTDAELKVVERRLAGIRHSLLYRILCRLGLLPR